MGIGQNLANSLTGNAAKAKILLVKKDATSPAGSGLGALTGGTATLDAIGQALGGKVFTVQFNPSSVSIYAHNEPIVLKTARTQTDSELPQQQTVAAGTTMSVELIFDDTNISDAFSMGNGLNTSVTNLVKTGINMFSKQVHSVRKYVEAFIAAAVDPQYGNLVFEWGTFRFTGVMRDFSAKYTMFNPKGEPIRATVSLNLTHNPTAETDKLEAKDFDELFKLAALPTVPSISAQPSVPTVPLPTADKFESLKKQYGGFEQPKSIVEVGGMIFDGESKKTKEIYLNNISVELTSGYEASVATFSLYNVFNVEKGIFEAQNVKNAICLGNPVTIKLGYITQVKTVFVGFVAEVNFSCEDGDASAIRITAMDAKGVMMANRYSKQLSAKYYSDAVKEILDKSVYGTVISEYKLDASPDGGKAATKGGTAAGALPSVPSAPSTGGEDKTKTIEMVDESDYEFILKAAKKFGFDFFITNGQVVYRKPKDGAQTTLSLKIGKGITSVNMGYSMIGITNFVEARSTDTGKGSGIIKKVAVGAKFPYGSAGTKLIKNSKKVYIDPTIASAEDAGLRAQALVEDMQYRFIQTEFECVGLPELLPGDFIDISLLGSYVTKCYITEVKHTMSTHDGYRVSIKAKAKQISGGTPSL